jgi:ryanodine receptor 2
MDKPPSRIKTVRLPNDPFAQSNGYKPAPLDLTNITLSGKLEELIDHLAENTHNVWAKERITQGWTYGLNEVCLNKTQMKLFLFINFMDPFCHFKDPDNKRSPHLVPYSNVDDIIKKANR